VIRYKIEITKMTIDKSLKVRRGISRSRNVLTRAERITRLQEQDRWTEADGPLGLPKVRVYKVVLKKKKKKKGDEEGAATPVKGKAAKAAAKPSSDAKAKQTARR
ncbi:MAG: small basic protein, partial [Thermoguttaceae bacterium]